MFAKKFNFPFLEDTVKQSEVQKPRVTSLVMLALQVAFFSTAVACILVTVKSVMEENIRCITGLEKVKQSHKAIETYCFISSTFTTVNVSNQLSAHPGVGPLTSINSEGELSSHDQRLHSYYQWVWLVLFIQAMAYYSPLWLWKAMDRDYFENIIFSLGVIRVGDPTADISNGAKYFVNSLNSHRPYSLQFLLCEFVGLVVSVVSLFVTNTFLGGGFLTKGLSVLRYLGHDPHNLNNPINLIFPKVAKCTWQKYGASGTIEIRDAMCVLPLNIVNEKTYIILWAVYILTAVACALGLLYHLALFLLPNVRNTMLVHRSYRTDTKNALIGILPKCNFGDWFLIYHFGSQMAYFEDWVVRVGDEIEK